MGVATADAAKEDTPPGFRMAFKKAIRRGPLVGINFEILRFYVDGDVFMGFFLDVDLRAYYSVEDFVGSFSEFRGFIGHVILGHGSFVACPSYDSVYDSFREA